MLKNQKFSLCTRLALALAAIAGWALLHAAQAQAQVGSIIFVDTAADNTAVDGFCSLREAIIAANNNSHVDTCGPGTGDDAIFFSLGAGNPQVDVLSPLPAITAPVVINGGTGGSTRVVLHGPGVSSTPGPGLQINAGGAGTTIRSLVINSFSGDGIYINGAANVTVVSTYIGTDGTGTDGQANSRNGILVSGAGASIGGTSGTSPGGPCTGDCNVIGNNAADGIFITAAGTLVLGNFIGITATGTGFLGNFNGVSVNIAQATDVTIGDATPAGRNVISANGRTGILTMAGGTKVQGNFIGTDATGTVGMQNREGVAFVNVDTGTVGGIAPGAGNLISGNRDSGVRFMGATRIYVYGNRIGTDISGSLPIPNGIQGVDITNIGGLGGASRLNSIGATSPAYANIIAFNGIGGVSFTAEGNLVSGNSIHDNGGPGINGSSIVTPPTITRADTTIAGTACVFCTIEVFADNADEGRTYLGTTGSVLDGTWSLAVPAPGPHITATATIPAASGGYTTSAFSAPFACPDFDHDGLCDAVDDADGDGVVDALDNCILVSNANQRDTDGDGYGNICDADLNNSGQVTTADYTILRNVLNQNASSSPTAAGADLNGSGRVTTTDYTILRNALNTPPGPSGLHPNCPPTCP